MDFDTKIALALMSGSIMAIEQDMARAVPDAEYWAEHTVRPQQREQARIYLLEQRMYRYAAEMRALLQQLDRIRIANGMGPALVAPTKH